MRGSVGIVQQQRDLSGEKISDYKRDGNCNQPHDRKKGSSFSFTFAEQRYSPQEQIGSCKDQCQRDGIHDPISFFLSASIHLVLSYLNPHRYRYALQLAYYIVIAFIANRGIVVGLERAVVVNHIPCWWREKGGMQDNTS